MSEKILLQPIRTAGDCEVASELMIKAFIDLPEIQGDEYLKKLTIDTARSTPLEVFKGLCQGWLIYSPNGGGAVGVVILSSPEGNPAARLFQLPDTMSDSQGSLRHFMSISNSLSKEDRLRISDPKKMDWISRFVVDPELQGKGIGKQAMEILYERANAENKSLGLQSRALDSCRFYHKCGGYHVASHDTTTIRSDGTQKTARRDIFIWSASSFGIRTPLACTVDGCRA